MSDLLIKDLTAFGLSEKEAQVYLTLLELGNASATQIAEKSGVNRSSVYVVIETLKVKGMVGSIEQSSIQEFFAISPEILIRSAETIVHTAQEKFERIQNALPALKGMYKNLEHRPLVRVFEGTVGLMEAMNETLTAQEKLLRTFTSGETTMRIMKDFIQEYALERIKRKIILKGIYVENEATRALTSDLLPEIKKHYEQSVYVPKENYPLPVDAMIWDDKVGYLIVEGGQVTTIVLEAKEIGLAMKNMFDMAFEQAKLNGTYEET